MLTLTVLEDPTDFAGMREEWDDLLRRSSDGQVFISHEWLHSWWATYGSGNVLHVVLCRDDEGSLAGVLPAYLSAGRHLHPHRLHLLGTEPVGSEWLGCLAAPGLEEEVYRMVFDHLTSAGTPWAAVELDAMCADSAFDRYVRSSIESRGMAAPAVVDDEWGCPGMALPGDWDTYLGALSKRARSMIRRARQDADAAGEVKMEVVDDPGSLDRALDDMIRLRVDRMHEKGFGRFGTTQDYREFHQRVFRQFMAAGWLKLAFLSINGDRVAYLCQFAHNDTTFAYETAFDGRWADQRVGILLFSLAIEQAITDGMVRFEFLRGDQRYKYQLGAHDRSVPRKLVLYSDTAAGRILRTHDMLARRTEAVVKQVLPESGVQRLREVLQTR